MPLISLALANLLVACSCPWRVPVYPLSLSHRTPFGQEWCAARLARAEFRHNLGELPFFCGHQSLSRTLLKEIHNQRWEQVGCPDPKNHCLTLAHVSTIMISLSIEFRLRKHYTGNLWKRGLLPYASLGNEENWQHKCCNIHKKAQVV